MMNVGFAIASVGGAALAGLLIGTFGISTALYVDAASFLVIAVAARGHAHPPRRRGQPRAVRGAPARRAPLRPRPSDAAAAPARPGGGPRPVHADRADRGHLRQGEPGHDVGRLRRPPRLLGRRHLRGEPALPARSRTGPPWALVVVSTLAIAVAYLGLAVAGTLLAACLISVIGGIGNGIQWIAVMTTLQEQTARDYQARITGLMESLGAAMPGVGFLLGGAIVAISSPRAAYAIAGGGLLLIVLAALPQRSRLRRRHGRAHGLPGPDRSPGLPMPETFGARQEAAAGHATLSRRRRGRRPSRSPRRSSVDPAPSRAGDGDRRSGRPTAGRARTSRPIADSRGCGRRGPAASPSGRREPRPSGRRRALDAASARAADGRRAAARRRRACDARPGCSRLRPRT